jgi:uncharacterized protein (TIGR02145 family)
MQFLKRLFTAQRTIDIGGQVWSAANLSVDHFRNGDPIPQVQSASAWAELTTGAWCYYDNNPAHGRTYGKLYNWHAVNDARGLAPEGWRVPSDADWNLLIETLGGEGEAGGKLKELGTRHWRTPNEGASNETGFSALPGGYRDGEEFCRMEGFAHYWSSSEAWKDQASGLYIGYHDSEAQLYRFDMIYGFSIRLVRC